MNNLPELIDPSLPGYKPPKEIQGSTVFVNKEGTSVIKAVYNSIARTTSCDMLTSELASMPLTLLANVTASNRGYYPPSIKEYFRSRSDSIRHC